jgi:hypothetical protein
MIPINRRKHPFDTCVVNLRSVSSGSNWLKSCGYQIRYIEDSVSGSSGTLHQTLSSSATVAMTTACPTGVYGTERPALSSQLRWNLIL